MIIIQAKNRMRRIWVGLARSDNKKIVDPNTWNDRPIYGNALGKKFQIRRSSMKHKAHWLVLKDVKCTRDLVTAKIYWWQIKDIKKVIVRMFLVYKNVEILLKSHKILICTYFLKQ